MPLSNPPDVAAAIAVHAAISDAHHSPPTTATGSYVGDGTNDRQITTGFKCQLVLVIKTGVGAGTSRISCPGIALSIADGAVKADCLLHATDGFVVDSVGMNENLENYNYFAVKEF